MPSLDMESAIGGRVAGVDEVGRGPLAGPVVAAAVILPIPLAASLADLLDDSKKLTAAQQGAAVEPPGQHLVEEVVIARAEAAPDGVEGLELRHRR